MEIQNQRNDRQLRLWQQHGQEALENANICVLNSSALASETLKNLVLPGIKSFTVIDAALVQDYDSCSNFFVDKSHLGSSRSKAIVELLLELNPDVQGTHINHDPKLYIDSNPLFFSQFSLVIASQLSEKYLLKLSEILWSSKIPLVVVKTYGFIGYLRIAVPEHTVIETHPENIVDLRLDDPFPTLVDFYKKFNFQEMDTVALSHTPYVVILLSVLAEFKEKFNCIPTSQNDKKLFKEMIKTRITLKIDQENFDEATAAAYRAFNVTRLSSQVSEILNESENIDANVFFNNYRVQSQSFGLSQRH